MAHFSQQYTTTVGAIQSRLESESLRYVEVQLQGVTVKARDPSAFDVYDGAQTVHVRENRHHYDGSGIDDARRLTIHREHSDVPDGTI